MIGQTIWIFDINRRVYREPRSMSGSPIYREHWRPVRIDAETSRSWVTQYGEKIPKKGEHRGVAFTEQEVDDDVWCNSHRSKIADAIYRLEDVATLRAIADLVGFKPEAGK